jgi:hypothetical protein
MSRQHKALISDHHERDEGYRPAGPSVTPAALPEAHPEDSSYLHRQARLESVLERQEHEQADGSRTLGGLSATRI